MRLPRTVKSYQFMEIIQECIAHSYDGSAEAAKLSQFMCTFMRSSVCMCVCGCLSVYLSGNVCNRRHKFGINVGILMRQL